MVCVHCAMSSRVTVCRSQVRGHGSHDEAIVREKGALGPGQLLAVDMAEGTLYHDTEIKDKLARPSHLVSGLAKSKTLMKRWLKSLKTTVQW